MLRTMAVGSVMMVCVGGVAQAQGSAVTVYGVADVGIFQDRVKVAGETTRSTGMVSGGQAGSRWGLRGSEDLGNGLKANFQLESGFNINNGTQGQNGRLFGRAAWGGLSGAFGEVRLGRQFTMSTSWFSPISPFGMGWRNAAIGKGGFRASDATRFDNLLTYISPKFGGAQLAAGYSFNTRGGAAVSDDRTTAWNVAGRFESGPLYVSATYDRLNPSNIDPNAQGRNPQAFQLGASYKLPILTLSAGWSQQKDGWIKSAEGAVAATNNNLGASAYFDGKVNAYLIGAAVPFGASELLASVQFAKPGSSAFPDGEDVKVYNLGYNYKLSKRTSVYGLVSYQDGNLYSFAKDASTTQVGVGLRHNF